MAVLRSEKFDNMKFMQDGRFYDARGDAEKAMETYREAGFDVRLLEEDGKFLVFTRRVVKETTVTQ